MRGYKGVAQFKKKWKMGHPNIHIKTPFWREAGVGFGSISVKMRRKDQSPINFYKNNMCAQKHTSLFRWQNPSFFQPFSLPVQMLGSLSKAIKACQGFKEGNWRWLKWKVRMWGQCWNSLNGRPVSGQSWILSWRPLDRFIWTLEKTESPEDVTMQLKELIMNPKEILVMQVWKPEAVCEFPAVLRFLRNLRKSGGKLDSARALIVPSSLSPAFYSNYNHLIWMVPVIIIMMRMLMMIRSCACFKTRTQGASHSPFC